MAIIMIEGFKVYDSLTRRSIIINSNFIVECMEVYTKYNLDGVAITTAHDYTLQDVDFLADFPNIRHLSISDGINDIKAIHSLSRLESLTISGKNRNIDFAKLPSLIDLNADWSSFFCNIDACVDLRVLSLYRFNPKEKNCIPISRLPWIKKLKITQSSITSLTGLGNFNQLEELSLNYCAKLNEICCLSKSRGTLSTLLLDHCKSITNYEYMILFQNLRTFAFNDAGIIPSIKFITKIASLEDVRFVGTDVIDGDLSPCIGLRYAGFSNKKHFSHSMEQIRQFS